MLGEGGEIAPPIGIGAVFGPTKLRYNHFIRSGGLGDDIAVMIRDHALGFECADIDAKCVGHDVIRRGVMRLGRHPA